MTFTAFVSNLKKAIIYLRDKKCSNTENCLSSNKSICEVCDYKYYLDKSNSTNYLCKSNTEENAFLHCSISENGKNCDVCLEPYFLSEDKKCVKTQYCNRGKTGTDQCETCSTNYYLSEDKYSCTITKNCKSGYGHNGKCRLFLDGFYNNLDDGKCYSNQQDKTINLENVKINIIWVNSITYALKYNIV